MVGVSGWAAWEAGGFAIAADKSVKIASETAERQLRAYVGVFKAGLKWESNRIIRARVTIKNFGQTPAYDVVHWMAAHINPTEFPKPAERAILLSKGNLGPQVEMHWDTTEGPLKDEQWQGIRSRKIPFYVWGEITYWDVFRKEPRSTKYRMMFPLDAKDAPDDTALTTCDQGNESN